jgi:single-strand DNA-binding protein
VLRCPSSEGSDRQYLRQQWPICSRHAERAYANFKVGDNFIASGYINEYEVGRNGQTRAREEFVARRIGHDLARTKYDVDRTPSRQPDPPGADLPTAMEPAPVVAL